MPTAFETVLDNCTSTLALAYTAGSGSRTLSVQAGTVAMILAEIAAKSQPAVSNSRPIRWTVATSDTNYTTYRITSLSAGVVVGGVTVDQLVGTTAEETDRSYPALTACGSRLTAVQWQAMATAVNAAEATIAGLGSAAFVATSTFLAAGGNAVSATTAGSVLASGVTSVPTGMLLGSGGAMTPGVAGTNYVSPSGLTTALSSYVTSTALTTALSSVATLTTNTFAGLQTFGAGGIITASLTGNVNNDIFRDTSVITLSIAATGYCSYDSSPTFNGTNSGTGTLGHGASFQARPTFNNTETVSDVRSFYSQPTLNGPGTVNFNYQYMVLDPGGAGPLLWNVGLLSAGMTRGTSGNYLFYNSGPGGGLLSDQLQLLLRSGLQNQTGAGGTDGALSIQTFANSAQQFNFGLNSGTGYGWIQANNVGTGAWPIKINPQGGQVQVGSGGLSIASLSGVLQATAGVVSAASSLTPSQIATGTPGAGKYPDGAAGWTTLPSGAVTSVAGRTGAVTIATTDVSGIGSYLTTAAAASTYSPLAGSSSIVTAGTIGTGTWQGTPVGGAYLASTGLTIAAYAGALTTDADASTVTFNLATTNDHLVVLGGNRQLALSNMPAHGKFTILVQQPASGGPWTVTWFSGMTIRWAGGTAPTLSTAAGKIDAFQFLILNSTTLLATSGLGF